MKFDQEHYILDNIGKKSIKQLSDDLDISERKIKRFIESKRIRIKNKESTPSYAQFRMPKKLLIIITIFAITLLTAIVFLPALFNNFVGWDDPEYVYENPLIRGFSLSNLKGIFTQSFQGTYCPLTIVSYAIEYHFFGAQPFIYHLTNYVLHILVTLSVLVFMYSMGTGILVAGIVSLLFGIHPLHVESVAWIAERKDVLYALFYILAMQFYLWYLKKNNAYYYIISLLLSVLSCLAKPMAVTIPLILFLIDYFNNRKFSLKILIEKIPFFAVALIVGLIAFKFQVASGVTNVGTDRVVRIYFLAKEIPFYLMKLIFPIPLSGIYPFYSIGPQHLPELYFNITVQILFACLIFYSSRYSKKFALGGLFFIITLLPVLKLVPTGDVFAADRYMYIPSIGIFYIISLWISKALIGHLNKTFKAIVIIALLLWVIFLCVTTINRCEVWRNSETFFLNILKQSPNIPRANINLGIYYFNKGDYSKAMYYFEKALALNASPALKEMASIYLSKAKQNK
jgi:Tetratricopeptide repeat.